MFLDDSYCNFRIINTFLIDFSHYFLVSTQLLLIKLRDIEEYCHFNSF